MMEATVGTYYAIERYGFGAFGHKKRGQNAASDCIGGQFITYCIAATWKRWAGQRPALSSSDGAPTLDDPNEQDHDRQYQENVDEPAQRI